MVKGNLISNRQTPILKAYLNGKQQNKIKQGIETVTGGTWSLAVKGMESLSAATIKIDRASHGPGRNEL